ncbi:MAG: GNAT family N-acetyltransferase [Acidobacteriota bacterium]|nr:GNAT family N-acetyltransferase [Acidobacteriota bacterium]
MHDSEGRVVCERRPAFFRILQQSEIHLSFPVNIVQAQSSEDIDRTRELFVEYASSLGIDLCFQNFEKELAELPGEYVPPTGRLFLAFDEDQISGCIALRGLGQRACELKRLYVRPEFRGKGLGRELTQAVIDTAREIGYDRVRLDTLPGKMDRAIAMYRSLGFREIEAYCHNPVPGATFMELSLT